MSNIVIVGSGPAGVSAALYAVRAGVQTTVLTKGSGALARAEKIENYYGFAQPVSGPELERRSIENARRLGVQFVQTEAVGLTWTDRLTVETLAGAYPADAVILATGASRAVPRIPGLTGLEGHGVSWCAACDAFFYRGKDVAVLGSGEYALHEVQALLPVVKSVTLLTNGAALTADYPENVYYCKRLTRDEIKSLMEQCTGLVCASRDDPMPTFVTEGLIFGKPSIVSEHTGTAGLVTEGVDGFLYKDDDPQQLADKLAWAIEHPEALAAMHDSCRRLYEQQFSNESYVATLTRLVKELTDGEES